MTTQQPEQQPEQQQQQQEPQPQQQQQTPSVRPDELSRSLGQAIEAINALPDRVVDALRQTGASPQQQQAARDAAQQASNQAQQAQTGSTNGPQVDQKSQPRTFADWFFGK